MENRAIRSAQKMLDAETVAKIHCRFQLTNLGQSLSEQHGKIGLYYLSFRTFKMGVSPRQMVFCDVMFSGTLSLSGNNPEPGNNPFTTHNVKNTENNLLNIANDSEERELTTFRRLTSTIVDVPHRYPLKFHFIYLFNKYRY